MKRLFIAVLLLSSCQQEDPQPNIPQCECTRYNQQMGPSGLWYTIDSEVWPQGTCDDDSLIVNETMMTRYIIQCQ